PVDITGDVTVSGATTRPINGRFVLTPVHIDQLNYAQWFWARASGGSVERLAPDQETAGRSARQAFTNGQASAVKAAAAACGADPESLRVEFRDRDLVGPSAGLVFALAVADLLDPADLAAGRTIAATGSIDATGRVFDVGFVDKKVAVARAAGADVLFVPRGQNHGFTGIDVIEVATLREAVAALRAQ
ncbi:MAG: Lon-like protease, partial [Actinomycetota bacterium]